MPKIVDHDRRRAEILDACLPLFAEQGYAALSMRGIAAALGVSTGALYYYFPSKEELFQAMFRHLSARDVAEAVAEIDPEGTERAERAPPAARVAALGRWLAHSADKLQQALAVALEYRRQPADPAILREALAVYRQALRDQLGLGEPEAAAALSFLLGLLVQRTLDPDAVDLDLHMAVLTGVTAKF